MKSPNRYLDLVIFLIPTLVLTGVYPITQNQFAHYIGLILLVFAGLYFLKTKSPLFGMSLFFIIVELLMLIPITKSIWLINIIIAIVVFFAISFYLKAPGLDKSWIKYGKIESRTIIWIGLIVIISSTALYLWSRFANPDLSQFRGYIQKIDGPFLIPVICLFSAFNALAEEAIFRGIFWKSLEDIYHNIPLAVVLTSLIYGLCHYPGVPSGWWGVLLASIYGMMLGILRHKTSGLAAPILAHFFADVTIVMILIHYSSKL